MDKQRKRLVEFAQAAKGFDGYNMLKLILFAAGAKPATFVQLKISPENLDEKAHFEKHLKAGRVPFLVSRPKAYEEIVAIKGNAVKWRILGTWFGYDLFDGNRSFDNFRKYLALVLYDYPACCITHYIKEHDLKFLRKNYTHYAYYKHLHSVERKYPLVMHTPCSTKCRATGRMNAEYARTIRNSAPKFWKSFTNVKKQKADVIVGSESELLQDVVYNIRSTAPVFPAKDGHEYNLITMKPIAGHYYMISHLTKKSIEKGTVLPAAINMKFDYADVKLGKPKKVIKNLHHERKFVIP